MLETLATETGKMAAFIILPIAGAVGVELLRIGGTQLLEWANPAIRILKRNFRTLDYALRFSSPELRTKILNNPITPYVVELLEEKDSSLTDEQVKTAVRWAARKFDWELHSYLSPDQMDERQATLARTISDRLGSKLLQQTSAM